MPQQVALTPLVSVAGADRFWRAGFLRRSGAQLREAVGQNGFDVAQAFAELRHLGNQLSQLVAAFTAEQQVAGERLFDVVPNVIARRQ